VEIQYFGANCIKINTKKASLVIDDNLLELGLKSASKPEDIAIFTLANANIDASHAVTLKINSPGEYEVSDISIRGVAAQSHIEEKGTNSVIYKLTIDEIRVLIIGHIDPKLTQEQLEAVGSCDIMIIPVGGSGYTLDAQGALTIIKEIEPKIVIPTHYADKAINYPVPQQELTEVIKELPFELEEPIDKLKVKVVDIPEQTKLVVLKRQ
jgi:L-ascorbate metabolism protein UlaG (beta-lactamase superfamily)